MIDQVQEASNVEFRKSINGYIATGAGLLEKYVITKNLLTYNYIKEKKQK